MLDITYKPTLTKQGEQGSMEVVHSGKTHGPVYANQLRLPTRSSHIVIRIVQLTTLAFTIAMLEFVPVFPQ